MTARIPLLLFLLFFVYFATGFFPVCRSEGDAVNIANGVHVQLATATFQENDFTYRFHSQPGTYALLYLITSLFKGDTYINFSILSIIAFILALLTATLLLSRILSMDFFLVGVILILCQETFCAGYYPSSTIFAYLFLAVSFCLVILTEKPGYQLSGFILLAFAVWLRFDAIMLAPLLWILFLQRNYRQPVLPILGGSLLFFLIMILYRLSAANIFTMMKDFSQHTGKIYRGTFLPFIPFLGRDDMKSYIAIFSFPYLIIFVLGLVNYLKKKKISRMAVIIGGIAPFLILMTGKITSPKYLYYYIPLFFLPICEWIKESWEHTGKLILIIIVLSSMQYIIGIHTVYGSKPHRSESRPRILHLLHKRLEGDLQQISLVCGAGDLYPTADFYRLSSGLVFAPLTWNFLKKELNINHGKTTDFINNLPQGTTILTTRMESFRLAVNILLKSDFTCQDFKRSNDDEQFEAYFSREEQNIRLIKDYYDETAYAQRDRKPLASRINHCPSSNILLIATAPWEQHLFQSSARNFLRISDLAFFFRKEEISLL
ncbi:MAG: hypothetical protein JXB60_07150 [Candidatus Cloacimonetes bacterium]|nr:hypothetical protein [Candidatus Cloacimonadota bacterium]